MTYPVLRRRALPLLIARDHGANFQRDRKGASQKGGVDEKHLIRHVEARGNNQLVPNKERVSKQISQKSQQVFKLLILDRSFWRNVSTIYDK